LPRRLSLLIHIDLDEVGLLRVKDVSELVDVGQNAVDQLLENLLLKCLLLTVLLVALLLKCDVDESQESKVHLRVLLEVGPLIFHQHL